MYIDILPKNKYTSRPWRPTCKLRKWPDRHQMWIKFLLQTFVTQKTVSWLHFDKNNCKTWWDNLHLDPEDNPWPMKRFWRTTSHEVLYHHDLHLKNTAQQLLTLHQIILAMTKGFLSGSSRECGTAMFLPSGGLPWSTKHSNSAFKGLCFWIAFLPSDWERWCSKQLLIEDRSMSHHS